LGGGTYISIVLLHAKEPLHATALPNQRVERCHESMIGRALRAEEVSPDERGAIGSRHDAAFQE
jgi:hypothetical protein